MLNMPSTYNAHLQKFEKTAYIKGKDEYEKLYRESIDDPDTFWARQAKRYLIWQKDWDSVLDYDMNEARIEWFKGGVLNASYNCLDRHMKTIPDKVAYFWEGDNPEDRRTVTYAALYKEVNKMAAALKAKGVVKGDRVILYMPMVVEQAVAVRKDEFSNLSAEFVEMAMQRFLALRDRSLRKRPATGELLVWLRVLALAVGTYPQKLDDDLSKLPYLGVLLKDHQDIEEIGGRDRF